MKIVDQIALLLPTLVLPSAMIGQSPKPVKLECVELHKRFDANADGELQPEERAAARSEI